MSEVETNLNLAAWQYSLLALVREAAEVNREVEIGIQTERQTVEDVLNELEAILNSDGAAPPCVGGLMVKSTVMLFGFGHFVEKLGKRIL